MSNVNIYPTYHHGLTWFANKYGWHLSDILKDTRAVLERRVYREDNTTHV